MPAAAIESNTASIRLKTPSWRKAEPFRVGLVGAGFIADYHAQVLRETRGTHLVGVSDPHSRRAKDVAARWGIENACGSVAELLDRARPDVAHVLAPPALHYQIARELLEAGVATFLEKPMTTDEADARRLAELSRQTGVPLAVNHNWRRQPLFVRALRDIAARKIGPVRHVVSINSLPLFQLTAGMHDHWMFQRPTNVLYEQAPHPLSQVVELVGDVGSVRPTWSGPMTLRGGRPFFTDWQLMVEGERANAQVHLSFGGAFPDARLHIVGVDGTIHIDQLNNLYSIDRRTKFIDSADRFMRGAQRAGENLYDAAAGIAGYTGSLLRLVGRKDAYYLGMKASVRDFYDELIKTGSASENLDCSLRVMRALQWATDAYDGPSVVVRPKALATIAAPRPNAPQALIIGGTGFIGRRVVKRFAEGGAKVRVLARSPDRIADLAEDYHVDIVRGDVLDPSDVERAAQGCDTIVHLVAGAPDNWSGFQSLYIDGLENTIRAATIDQSKRLIFASSIAALYLGNPNETITDETPADSRPDRRCYYARAKILCERLIEEARQKRRLNAVVMRPGIVIGPGTPPQHLGVGEWPSPITCVRWGRELRSPLPLVLVDDVADAFWRAAIAPHEAVCGKAFNLVGDAAFTPLDYVDRLRIASGRDFRILPQSVAFWTALELFKWGVKAVARKSENVRLTWREVAYRTGLAHFDNTGVKETLGWSPEADREALAAKGIDAALEAT